MTTSGTYAFNLDLNDIVEEAFERAGSELRTGYDMKTARRSLNIMFMDWANRGINMWTIEQGEIPLVQGQVLYPLPDDTVDLVEHVIRTSAGSVANQTDINISRISVSTYSTIPNKITQGRPIQVYVDRQSGTLGPTTATLAASISSSATSITVSDASQLVASGFILVGTEVISYSEIIGNTLTNCSRGQNNTTAAAHSSGDAIFAKSQPNILVWPSPDQGAVGNPYYTFVYWRMRRIQDAAKGGTGTFDVPFRFIPCLTAGLAYNLALKIQTPESLQRLPILKGEYDVAWELAAGEDHEKAPLRFVPREMFY
jgi:hypothetical protein